jgi:hypothetical protein
MHRPWSTLREEITMSINMSNDKNIPTDTEAYYETVASQEEIYREETEEEVRAILTSDDRSPGENLIRGRQRSMFDSNNNACIAESLDEQLNHAAFVPPLP